jgi:uncharacterized damage-inducible protein DinB
MPPLREGSSYSLTTIEGEEKHDGIQWQSLCALTADPLSATELRRAWSEVNNKLTTAFERFTIEDWLEKHTAGSDEEFVKDPTCDLLAIVMIRTNHASYHSGQAALAK